MPSENFTFNLIVSLFSFVSSSRNFSFFRRLSNHPYFKYNSIKFIQHTCSDFRCRSSNNGNGNGNHRHSSSGDCYHSRIENLPQINHFRFSTVFPYINGVPARSNGRIFDMCIQRKISNEKRSGYVISDEH